MHIYLPKKWGLVAFDITVAILDKGGFVDSQIIVLDGLSTPPILLRNEIKGKY